MITQRLKNIGSSVGFLIIQICLMILWGTQLIESDAYYVNYVLLIAVTAVCCYRNIVSGILPCIWDSDRYTGIVLNVFSLLFSGMVAFANYRIWAYPEMPESFGVPFRQLVRILLILCFFAGGYFAFWHVFHVIFLKLNSLSRKSKHNEGLKPHKVFLFTFLLLAVSRGIILFFCQYPGELSPDSLAQITQILSGEYSNHHPFYHTMLIKCFFDPGLRLFGDINAGVAAYCVFQILFTSMSFSFAVSTMARMKMPVWTIIVSIVFFFLMPYHIIYAITVWKDVMFGCFILLFVTFIFRYMQGIGNKILSYAVLCISGIGICLFRSNGFFVAVLLAIAFALLWKAADKKVLLIFVSVLAVSFIMKHPVLSMIGVSQPGTMEYLAIPTQQVARVVYEGHELEDWEKTALSEIIDIEQITENYKPYISDPIKNLVLQKGNQQLIAENKGKYIKLYCSLGMKHPAAYLRAWIDQTRGYWNAGYDYWRWTSKVYKNDLGIERMTKSTFLDRMLKEYLWLFTNIHCLRLFLSIGLFIWIDLLMLMISLLRKDRPGVFVSLPALAITSSLLITTPVYSEFRYIYAVFCLLPTVMTVTFRPED